jgi:hypothetical protein
MFHIYLPLPGSTTLNTYSPAYASPSSIMEFHAVSKSDNRVHATFSLDKSTYPEQQLLPAGCVRVQPVVISLTSNNLSYARLGEMLRWYADHLDSFARAECRYIGGMHIQSPKLLQQDTAITHSGVSCRPGGLESSLNRTFLPCGLEPSFSDFGPWLPRPSI